MKKPVTKDRPIVEGLIAGTGALVLSFFWIIFEAFPPWVVFLLYLAGLFCLSLSSLWIISGGDYSKWFAEDPVRFFFFSVIVIALVVVFLDYYYLGKLGGILVEAHGLVFDLLIFGILLAVYERIRSKHDKVQRYLEELDDYRGWRDPEAGYRVRGVLRRLQAEGAEVTDYGDLHLGQCSQETIERAVKLKAYINSLEGASMVNANLEEAFLFGAKLTGAYLLRANLQFASLNSAIIKAVNLHGSNLYEANLESATLEDSNLGDSDLRKAKMMGTNLQRVKFLQADLEQADLFEADLTEAVLLFAKLYQVNFQNAKLIGAQLDKADIRGASFYGASLTGASLIDVNIKDTNFRQADLTNAIVDDMNWIENLPEDNHFSKLYISENFYVDAISADNSFGVTRYRLRRKERKVASKMPLQCIATTKKGFRCKNRPRKGTNTCHLHEGR